MAKVLNDCRHRAWPDDLRSTVQAGPEPRGRPKPKISVRARDAALNIVPTSNGCSKALEPGAAGSSRAVAATRCACRCQSARRPTSPSPPEKIAASVAAMQRAMKAARGVR